MVTFPDCDHYSQFPSVRWNCCLGYLGNKKGIQPAENPKDIPNDFI